MLKQQKSFDHKIFKNNKLYNHSEKLIKTINNSENNNF